MKVLRLHAVGDLRLHDENDPLPKHDECLLRITAVGICGSDVHWYEEAGIGDAHLKRPLVLGHEFAGIIDSGDQQGRKAAVDPAVACRQCRYCEESRKDRYLPYPWDLKCDRDRRETGDTDRDIH